jgi:hypothetical protein
LSVPDELIRTGEKFTRTFTFTANTDTDVIESGISAQTEDRRKVSDTRVNTDLVLLGVLIDNSGGWKEISGYQTLATLQKNLPFAITTAFKTTAGATVLQDGSLRLFVITEDAPKDADPIIVTWDEFSLTKAVKTVTVNGLVGIDIASSGEASAVYAFLNNPD